MTTFDWQLEKAARRIIKAVSLALRFAAVEKDLFDLRSGHNNQLLLLQYPPISTEIWRKHIVARMPAHRDWRYENRIFSSATLSFSTPLTLMPSTIKLLLQDECGGLEFEDPNHAGSFLRAFPVPGVLTLNVGDMIKRFSNGAFLFHRFMQCEIDIICATQTSSHPKCATSSSAPFTAPFTANQMDPNML